MRVEQACKEVFFLCCEARFYKEASSLHVGDMVTNSFASGSRRDGLSQQAQTAAQFMSKPFFVLSGQ